MTDHALAQIDGNVPPHVPPELVIDFDLYNPAPSIEDLQELWHDLQQNNPAKIFWTPRNGGHWVPLAGKDIEYIMQDYEHFSSDQIMIPPNVERPYRQVPIEMDPPESTPFRRVMLRPLMPDMMPPLEEKARALTIELIEGFKDKGECEFMDEFAFVLPISVFLGMMELPTEDRDLLKPWADAMTKSPSPEERAAGQTHLMNYISSWVKSRRENPGTDYVSHIVTSDVGDRRMTDIEANSMCAMLLLGGLDTVANMLGFFALYLARHPSERQQLIDDPSLINNATEELIRRNAMVAGGRVVAKETTIRGVTMKPGDMVQMPSMLYGLDDSIVENPLDVDFRRDRPPHRAFGHGIHVCPGQHLARRELRIFLEEWLRRIPHFEIKPGKPPKIVGGLVGGPVELHLSWPARKN